MQDIISLNEDQSLIPLSEQVWVQHHAPELTVLILSYNHINYIEECLDAVLSQKTNFRVEIIIHDDASDDQTQKLLTVYQAKYPGLIRLILQEENQFSKNVNIYASLHQMAQGSYIARCDGDDRWGDPYKLQQQIHFLKCHPEFVLCFHSTNSIDQNGVLLKEDELLKSADQDYSKAELRELRCRWIPLSSACYRNVIDEFPPEYALVNNGDMFFLLLLAKFGGAKFQSEIKPYAYRQHDKSYWSQYSTGKKNKMHLESILQILAYLIRIDEKETAKIITFTRFIPYFNEHFYIQSQNILSA